MVFTSDERTVIRRAMFDEDDLVADALPGVQAPTLLIVGGHDPEVLGLNRAAQRRLPGASRLEVVPGAPVDD